MFSTPKNIKSTHRFWELSLDCFWVFVYRFLNVVPLVNDKPKYTIYSYSKVPQTWNSCSTKFPVLKSHIQHHFLEDDEVLKSHIQHHLQYPKYFVVILAAKKSPCPSTRSKQPPAYSMVVGSFPKFRATSWISNCLSWFTLIFPESNKGINFRKNMLCSRSIHFFPPPSQKKKTKNQLTSFPSPSTKTRNMKPNWLPDFWLHNHTSFKVSSSSGSVVSSPGISARCLELPSQLDPQIRDC